jgi:hypothetical protein
MSLDYENVQQEMTLILDDIVRNQTDMAKNIDEDLGRMQLFCQNNTEFTFQAEDSDYVVTVPCTVVAEGSESIIKYSINQLVEQAYYKEYDCDFWDCSYDPPFHLISLKAKNYWQGLFYWALLTCIVLAVLGFFLIENKKNLPFMLGGLAIIAALPFVRVSWLFSLLGYWDFLQYFTLFFSKAYNVFLINIIIGILLIGIGVVLKFLGIGQLIGKLFGGSKSGSAGVDKKALKEEIKQEMKQEAKLKEKAKQEKKK